MRRLTIPLIAAALVLLAAAPAGAGLGPVTYVFDPLSGPPGTVVSVSGDDCSVAEVQFWDNTGVPMRIGSTPVNPDGTWAGTITIPADAAPGSTRQIGAQCGASATQYVLFEVTGAPGTTTATTATTSTTAPAATAAPAFTG